MRFVRLVAVFLRLGILNVAAYRANFCFQVLESVLSFATALGTLGVVFSRTDTLAGWSREELLAVLGVYFLVLGLLNVMVAPSLSRLLEDVRTGAFDYTLTKPVDAQLLASISQVRVWKVTEVALGIGLLVFAVGRLAQGGGAANAVRFGVALLAGGSIVYSFWVMLATLSFWFVRVDNIMMIFWSVYSAARWPVTIYPSWLRWAFTAVVPVAFAVTVPVEAISGRTNGRQLVGTVAVAVLLGVASRRFWKRGLRRYAGASA
jgi:ABC-2 type transport system permease protein